MKRLLTMILPVLGVVAPVLAQTAPAIPDADGNGTWSLAELQTVWPDLTDEVYLKVDSNADGGVDQAELTVALTDGVLKPVE